MADYTDMVTVPIGVTPTYLGAQYNDVEPPVVTVVSPTPGGVIGRTEPFVLTVQDDMGIRLSVITALFPGYAHEVVWIRDRWGVGYSTSTRAAISGGYQYTIRRTGGWIFAPTFTVEAIDVAGAEAT